MVRSKVYGFAPYIDDALNQQLILLGGATGADRPGYRDWNNILINIGKLESHREFANAFDTNGTILILMACVWADIYFINNLIILTRYE